MPREGGADGHPDPLPAPDEDVDAETTLDQLVPRSLAVKDRAATLVLFAATLERAAKGALATSTERARAVLDAMSAREGAFEPFISASDDGPELAPARAKVVEIATALEPSVIALSRHPDPAMRTKAIVLLARSKSDTAGAAIAQAVTDSSESVQRVALASLGQHADQKTAQAVAKVMRSHESWAMRVLAAQALGRLGAAGAAAEATRQLKEAATKEAYALVREAALLALASYDKTEASQLAVHMATHDAEPRVRETAMKIRSAR